MKVIDLLNKIANGEEVPKQIFYKKQWWEYNPYNDYEGTEWGGCLLNNVLINELNDKIIICVKEDKEIEEKSKELYELCKTMYEEDREIEKLGETYINFNGCTRAFKDLNDYGGKILANKIDEIIDILNELKKGK